MSVLTPFEVNMLEQSGALEDFCDSFNPRSLEPMDLDGSTKIIFTGMGSSHFAARSTWEATIAAGLNSWWIDTGQLLDNSDLIDESATLVMTSQSGASGEIVELLRKMSSGSVSRPAFILGIANDESSPLASESDAFLPLHSGDEATVSTKSYLNSLAAHRHILGRLRHESMSQVGQEIEESAAVVATQISTEIPEVFADHLPGDPSQLSRFATIGQSIETSSALFASLIIKEAAKVPIEGYQTGDFRHGPFELAGPGLTAVLFGVGTKPPSAGLGLLAQDLVASGSNVISIGDEQSASSAQNYIEQYGTTAVARQMTGAVIAQKLAIQLAKANGVVPGQFLFGSKVTSTI